MSSSDILSQIVQRKKEEVAELRLRGLAENWEQAARDRSARFIAGTPIFLSALRDYPPVRVIAEFKRASPSAGKIADARDPDAVARDYAASGAACMSVLTDHDFFQGSLDDLIAVRNAVDLPILRKEFIIDPLQIWEAKMSGADACLLIAECLTPAELKEFVALIHELGMEALVELYEPDNLRSVLVSGTRIVGINNRNLRTFVTSLDHTFKLMKEIPRDFLIVSESGIKTAEDVRRLKEAGVQAILVGESLMRASQPGSQLRQLLEGV